MRYHAENNKAQAERVRQLQALHESWLAYHTDPPTHREKEGESERKRRSLLSLLQAKRKWEIEGSE